jgi:hypothetical protein
MALLLDDFTAALSDSRTTIGYATADMAFS